jgi:ubiquinone/menaquinone biosynthesis C-methylase UbiE
MEHDVDGETLQLPLGREWLSYAEDDPARFYYWPMVRQLYRKRVLMCLKYCRGGERILEIGFGSGVAFMNLAGRYREIHGIDLHAPVDSLQRVFRGYGVNCFLRNGSALNLPYPDEHFESVLLISILEHLKTAEVRLVCREIHRVLKSGKDVVYGVPVERRLLRLAFLLFGYNIRKYHFSTENQVADLMREVFVDGQFENLTTIVGSIYQVGVFRKPAVVR